MAMTYRQSIVDAMAWLAEQPDAVFIGQTVVYGGSFFASSLEKVPMERRIELPVMEEAQMGIGLGMALEGLVPVLIYPRCDFLMLAMNQLVNHADKIGAMSEGKMQPRMIIRTAVGPKTPLDGGPQHTQDHSETFKIALTTVNVCKLQTADIAYAMYLHAYRSGGVWLFVEMGEMYQS